MARPFVRVGLALAIAIALSTASRAGVAAACWRPPVDAPVVDPFREPACTWCAGNRGLEFQTASATTVRAAAAGRVEFAGSVARVAYVVVRLPNGWRHTYGRLSTISVRVGAPVLAGQPLGRTDRDLFFGWRIGDRHVDPAPRLGALVVRPRLVPLDGSPRRPASPPVLRCPASR